MNGRYFFVIAIIVSACGTERPFSTTTESLARDSARVSKRSKDSIGSKEPKDSKMRFSVLAGRKHGAQCALWQINVRDNDGLELVRAVKIEKGKKNKDSVTVIDGEIQASLSTRGGKDGFIFDVPLQSDAVLSGNVRPCVKEDGDSQDFSFTLDTIKPGKLKEELEGKLQIEIHSKSK